MSLVGPIQAPQITGVEGAPKPQKSLALDEAFGSVLEEARKSEQASTEASEKFANGDPSIGIHEVMIASEKASLAVRYVTTLKNKALDAYRELMNTQV